MATSGTNNSNPSSMLEKSTALAGNPAFKLARIHRMASETLMDAGQVKQLLMRVENFGIDTRRTGATLSFGKSTYEFQFKDAESAARMADLISTLLERDDDPPPSARR